MSYHSDPFAHALNTANEWLAVVADRLRTDDRRYAHRVFRAWLHTVRDRLGVSAAAHFAAQLPELWRGSFYEGWIPSHVPVSHDVASFVAQFAREAGVSQEAAIPLAGTVTDALVELFSPGQLDHVLAQVPIRLRQILLGADFSEMLARLPGSVEPETSPAEVERRLHALSEAVTEDDPGAR